jgi:predicted HTH transcriptional regulator
MNKTIEVGGRKFTFKTEEKKPDLPPISRHDDGDASREGERRMNLGPRARMMNETLEAIKTYPGKTYQELSHLSNIPSEQLHKRLADLKNPKCGKARAEIAEPCSVTGIRSQRWYPV